MKLPKDTCYVTLLSKQDAFNADMLLIKSQITMRSSSCSRRGSESLKADRLHEVSSGLMIKSFQGSIVVSLCNTNYGVQFSIQIHGVFTRNLVPGLILKVFEPVFMKF